jgi:hypothetical protein
MTWFQACSRRRRFLHCALIVSLVALLSGCAARSPYVLARRDAGCNLTATSKIALASHAQPREAELALERALVSALHERGIDPGPPAQADFTLAYWLDDSWIPGKKVEYYHQGRWTDICPQVSSGPMVIGPSGSVFDQESTELRQRVVDVPYYIQGIRLKLYPKSRAGVVSFQPAWEGYIAGGNRVSATREPALLRTLLRYFGEDFNGRAPLAD